MELFIHLTFPLYANIALILNHVSLNLFLFWRVLSVLALKI